MQLHQRLKQPAADVGARAAAAATDGINEPAGTSVVASAATAAAVAASTGANPFLAPPSLVVVQGGHQPGCGAAGMGPDAAGGLCKNVGAPGATAFQAVLDAAAADCADVDVRDRGGVADGLDWKYVHHVDTVTGVWLSLSAVCGDLAFRFLGT